MKLEYPKETGVYDAPNQFVPTETAINPANGDIYVTDGYGANYGDNIFAAAYRSGDASWLNSGYIQVIDKDMKAISTPGGSEPIYKDGKLQR